MRVRGWVAIITGGAIGITGQAISVEGGITLRVGSL